MSIVWLEKNYRGIGMNNKCVKWDFPLLKRIAEAAGKNPDGLRYTIIRLARDLNIQLPRSKIKREIRNNYRTARRMENE